MPVEYYDNLEDMPAEDAPGFVEVERIYCFDWLRFGDEEWRALAESYESLPGSMRTIDNMPV